MLTAHPDGCWVGVGMGRGWGGFGWGVLFWRTPLRNGITGVRGGVQAESGPNEIAEGGISPEGGLGWSGGLHAQLNPAAEWRNRFYKGGGRVFFRVVGFSDHPQFGKGFS